MKKAILSVLAIALSAQAVAPSIVQAQEAREVQQMSRQEKIMKLQAAQQALSKLETQLKEAKAQEDGNLAVKIKEGALISGAILAAVTVLGVVKMSGGAPGNSGSYRWGSATIISALGSLAAFAVAGGTMMFTPDEAKKVEAQIATVKERISHLQASLQ